MIEKYKYVRIQGRELAEYTNYANGVFGIFRDFEKKNVMTDEDHELYVDLLQYFVDTLPWPPMCNEHKKVICFFKTATSDEMMKHMKPMLWLLDRYNHPYDIVFTNYPGNIIYEDEYQIVVTIDDLKYKNSDIDVIKEDIFESLGVSPKE